MTLNPEFVTARNNGDAFTVEGRSFSVVKLAGMLASFLSAGGSSTPTNPTLPAANTLLLLRAGTAVDTYADASDDARAVTESGTIGGVSHDATNQFFTGSDSILFTQTATNTSTGAGLDVDKQTLGATLVPASTEFFFEAKIRLSAIPDGTGPYSFGAIVSTYNSTFPTLLIRILTTGFLEFFLDPTVVASNSALSIDTDYTVAISRDSSDVIRMFIDGVEQTATATDAGVVGIDEWTLGYLEAAELSIPRTQLFQGNMDELVIVSGASIHTSSYTPETERYVLS